MIKYFGYGSNMDFIALKAKGVVPAMSRPATLAGWRLRFNVEHFFRHEGGVGNIEQTGNPDDCVMGILHECNDADLAMLDRLEAFGVGYDRVEAVLETRQGAETAFAYVGLPDFVNDACLPTRRYLNILVRGAENAKLDPSYVNTLRAQPILQPAETEPFQPESTCPTLTHKDLHPLLTVLAGHVFDMGRARAAHRIAQNWFGGKDVTVFHLKRMDSSSGQEQLKDVIMDDLRPDQRRYLNTYLHAFAEEYDHIALFDYASIPLEKQLS